MRLGIPPTLSPLREAMRATARALRLALGSALLAMPIQVAMPEIEQHRVLTKITLYFRLVGKSYYR